MTVEAVVVGERAEDGGGIARRAVLRWAWRLFRREWRQQLLVLTLLSTAVAAAVAVSTGVHTIASTQDDAIFGSATYLYTLDGVDPAEVDATVSEAIGWFDQVEIIRRDSVMVAGRSEPIDVRAQDPQGAFGSTMLALRAGRYPDGASEVAIAESLADQLGIGVGDQLDVATRPLVVAGVVENPHNLDDTFVLIDHGVEGEFGSLSLLAEGERQRAEAFRGTGGTVPVYAERGAGAGLVAVGVLGITELALVLVSLIAAAGFAAVAQRRQRQLGMLAAIGATQRHLRLVMLANGAIVGTAAAVAGAIVGRLAWYLAVPTIEQLVGQRIDRLATPWWLIATIAALTVTTATAAAWWPARALADIPITESLSGRPPRPHRTQRSVSVAGGLLAGGAIAVATAGDIASPRANGIAITNALMTASGTVAVIVGVLLLSPFAIELLARRVSLLRLPPRLAVRDLARYQTRSAAALAAISLALGIPFAIILAAATAQDGPGEGNVSAQQILITAEGTDSPFASQQGDSEHQRASEAVDRIAAELDASVVELHKVLDPASEPTQFGLETIRVDRTGDDGDGPPLYAASPDLLEALQLDPPVPEVELITSQTGELAYAGAIDPATGRHPPQPVSNAATVTPGYTSLPVALITPDAIASRGWQTAPAGWLIQTAEPITADQIAAARDEAITAGLSTETRHNQRGLLQLRAVATITAATLALGVLAMTIGLLRSEATRDLQILAAAGAPSTTRRAITASAAAALTSLGVILGAAGAVIGIVASSRQLPALPIINLAVIALGVPALAAAAAWAVAGREPNNLSRQSIG